MPAEKPQPEDCSSNYEAELLAGWLALDLAPNDRPLSSISLETAPPSVALAGALLIRACANRRYQDGRKVKRPPVYVPGTCFCLPCTAAPEGGHCSFAYTYKFERVHTCF